MPTPDRAKVKPLGWDAAIDEAHEQIRKAKYRIATLEGAIAVFESHKQAGDTFPSVDAQKRALNR